MNSLLGNLQSVLGNGMTQPIQIFNAPAMSGQKLNRINGIDEVNRFQIGPNSEVPLFQTDDDVFYVKVSDQNGNVTTRRFRFYEESMEGAKYVTNDEFNKFKEEVLNGQQSIQQLIKQQSAGPRKYKSNKRYDERPAYDNVEATQQRYEPTTSFASNDGFKPSNQTNTADS